MSRYELVMLLRHIRDLAQAGGRGPVVQTIDDGDQARRRQLLDALISIAAIAQAAIDDEELLGVSFPQASVRNAFLWWRAI